MFVLITCANCANLGLPDELPHLVATTMYVAVVVKTNTPVHLLMLVEVFVYSHKVAVIIGSGNISTMCRGIAAVRGISRACGIIHNSGDGFLLMCRHNNEGCCCW